MKCFISTVILLPGYQGSLTAATCNRQGCHTFSGLEWIFSVHVLPDEYPMASKQTGKTD